MITKAPVPRTVVVPDANDKLFAVKLTVPDVVVTPLVPRFIVPPLFNTPRSEPVAAPVMLTAPVVE